MLHLPGKQDPEVLHNKPWGLPGMQEQLPRLRILSLPQPMHRKQEPCESDCPAYLGSLHGTNRGHPPHTWDEEPIRPEKRNDWKDLWIRQRIPWFPIHKYDWKSTDVNESRANIHVYKSQETGQVKGREALFFCPFQLLVVVFRWTSLKHKTKWLQQLRAETTLSTIWRGEAACPWRLGMGLLLTKDLWKLLFSKAY